MKAEMTERKTTHEEIKIGQKEMNTEFKKRQEEIKKQIIMAV